MKKVTKKKTIKTQINEQDIFDYLESKYYIWSLGADKMVSAANDKMENHFNKEFEKRCDQFKKQEHHMKVVEEFLKIQTEIFQRLEKKLK